MPDLKSELQKTKLALINAKQQELNISQKEETKMNSQPMTTGQKIFGYIVQNPGKTSIEYLSLIGATGVKKGSITSYISQMLKNRVINKDVNGKLTPAVKSFKG